jgi:hypothetical protein
MTTAGVIENMTERDLPVIEKIIVYTVKPDGSMDCYFGHEVTAIPANLVWGKILIPVPEWASPRRVRATVAPVEGE